MLILSRWHEKGNRNEHHERYGYNEKRYLNFKITSR